MDWTNINAGGGRCPAAMSFRNARSLPISDPQNCNLCSTVVVAASLFVDIVSISRCLLVRMAYFSPTTIRTPSSRSQVLARASGPASIVALKNAFCSDGCVQALTTGSTCGRKSDPNSRSASSRMRYRVLEKHTSASSYSSRRHTDSCNGKVLEETNLCSRSGVATRISRPKAPLPSCDFVESITAFSVAFSNSIVRQACPSHSFNTSL